MDHIEADATPAEEWKKDLNATCNRLSSQYLSLLRAASSTTALEDMGGRQDPRAGGGTMSSLQNPPPPTAADAAWHELQTQLAVENLCVASLNMLELIRKLRLSLLLMDEDTMMAEEEYQVLQCQKAAQEAQVAADEMEAEWRKLRNTDLAN
mmetsp:Transcript_1186/g.1817  ORF Transcript_1186/g.1817 Transcript_1186/m.1817 type:complete len:152 (+) Transcript_1186:76-531(+)|eukprot:CAMPEP_0194209236 /NCGR_PEP_ID=MMETSP0156-20130528/7434_1 /TAXON_ID=33649 /ORGANISM="Thalassionema nitzschioides, Strain L26-B" /LENGTH=151 /DNA_ID=CAMNT_0038936371 /DNA_START=33 /DNA_END=488 /DNA_ORIENTATION=+